MTDKRQTNSFLRKHISASDPRVSSAVVGYVWAIIIVAILTVIIILDLPFLLNYIVVTRTTHNYSVVTRTTHNYIVVTRTTHNYIVVTRTTHNYIVVTRTLYIFLYYNATIS
jgi:hypothetical protein